MTDIGTPLGNENMFGKQRGRYDEMLAVRLARSLPDQCFGIFMAMDDAGREEFAVKVNGLFEKCHPKARKWRVS
jgi:hypothetical protein